MKPDEEQESLTDFWEQGREAKGGDRMLNGERYDGMPDNYNDDDDDE